VLICSEGLAVLDSMLCTSQYVYTCSYAGCSRASSKVYDGLVFVWRALKQLFSPKLWSVTVVLIIM